MGNTGSTSPTVVSGAVFKENAAAVYEAYRAKSTQERASAKKGIDIRELREATDRWDKDISKELDLYNTWLKKQTEFNNSLPKGSQYHGNYPKVDATMKQPYSIVLDPMLEELKEAIRAGRMPTVREKYEAAKRQASGAIRVQGIEDAVLKAHRDEQAGREASIEKHIADTQVKPSQEASGEDEMIIRSRHYNLRRQRRINYKC